MTLHPAFVNGRGKRRLLPYQDSAHCITKLLVIVTLYFSVPRYTTDALKKFWVTPLLFHAWVSEAETVKG
jgi:hypothetical protein